MRFEEQAWSEQAFVGQNIEERASQEESLCYSWWLLL